MPSERFCFGLRARNQKIEEVYQWDDKPTRFYDFVAKTETQRVEGHLVIQGKSKP